MTKPVLKKENIDVLYDNKFVKLYDLQYKEGRHYMNASRRKTDDLTALKSDEEFKTMLADAVSCFVILIMPDGNERILMNYEFRYPTGQFLLSVPAGLIDPEDKEFDDPLVRTAKREIFEETGLVVKDTDKVEVVNPLAFSTPGMTDESNALVCAVIDFKNQKDIDQSGAVGSELFDGYILISKEEARKILKDGRDPEGNFYSVYTWAGLMYFISDMWK